MDTELMKVADEFASFDLLKPKDRLSPAFSTQETHSMFIISAQLKGYSRRNIKVERNEDGSRITVIIEKPIQEILMVGGKVVKKNIDTQRFHNSFEIVHGVVLDKIKVAFNEDDSKLIIRIPKATKGFMGAAINELKTQEIPSEPTILLKVYTNEELSEQENQDTKDENDVVQHHFPSKEDASEEPKPHRRRFKMCKPLIFGSAFFISLIVMVFHVVQSEKPEKQKQKTNQD
ncbi:hypothetical protein OSB04_007832 [Centaurea solstitialis]|uniref:SHSP domain-containing protein n=1 Tax=Centaurea solstitialis TaxID=347529 RepID=A0AA38WIV4_9ASTR|nr:hypothetical protein OSB04_007832 [Centaurea solstitialis]